MQFVHVGTSKPEMAPLLHAFELELLKNGLERATTPEAAGLVLYNLTPEHPKSYRRGGKGIFVLGFALLPPQDCDIGKLYPLLVRTLCNLLIVFEEGRPDIAAHIITPENGHMLLSGDDVFDSIYARVEPLANARLIIDNIFEPDLEPELWDGDEQTAAIARAGRQLASLELLPTPFPIAELLSPDDLRWLKRVYGIGGLSYGNFSARLDEQRFWMSASGVDKSRLETIGRDILLVKGYDEKQEAMLLSVPPNIEPRRVSVDAIEHWMIYHEQPAVTAILHVHAWLEGVTATAVHYPCGTYELARAVADLVGAAPDPQHAVVGLKNHGLTVAGTSLDDIIERVGGRLVRQVPVH